MGIMKRISLFIFVIVITAAFFSCSKEKESERFKLLTAHIWRSDSLLVNGVDAGGPGGMLEKFKGMQSSKKTERVILGCTKEHGGSPTVKRTLLLNLIPFRFRSQQK